MKSSIKAWSILGIISLALLVLGHQIAGREGILWALVFSLSINCLIYLYVDQKILDRFQGLQLEGRDPWGVLDMVQILSKRAKIPIPEITVIDNPAPQAMTIGRNWHAAHIVLTRGLLERLTKQEREAVLAYCIATIQRQDTLTYLVVSAFCGTILKVTGFLDTIFRVILGTKSEQNTIYSHFFTFLLSPLCAFLTRSLLSSSAYFESDETAAKLLNDSSEIAKILWKLDSYRATFPFRAHAAFAHAFIVNPLTGKGWTRYFQPQPKTEQRIENLIGYYPI